MSGRAGSTRESVAALMLAQPSVIKRPVLDIGGRLLVGFNPDSCGQALRDK